MTEMTPERKKMMVKIIIVVCLILAGLAALSWLPYRNIKWIKHAENATSILEPKRVKFLKKIKGFELKDIGPQTDSPPALYSSFFGVEKFGKNVEESVIIALITAETKCQYKSNNPTQSQYYCWYSIFVSSESVNIYWNDRPTTEGEYRINKNLRTGKIDFYPDYIDKETAAIIFEQGMHWFYKTRKHFEVDTLEGLKSKVEQKRQEREFDFR